MIHGISPSLVSYLLRSSANYPGEWANGIANPIEMVRYIHYIPFSRILHSSFLSSRRLRDDKKCISVKLSIVIVQRPNGMTKERIGNIRAAPDLQTHLSCQLIETLMTMMLKNVFIVEL